MTACFEYEVLIAQRGATDFAAPDLVLGLDELQAVPEPGGHSVRPLDGNVVSSPYPLHLVDRNGIITEKWGENLRPNMGGRLIRILRRELPAGDPEILDTGRISDFGEDAGPGRNVVEVTDERYTERRSRVFGRTTTVQLLPYGLVEPFGPPSRWGRPAAGDAVFVVRESAAIEGDAVRLTVADARTRQPEQDLAEWVLGDLVPIADLDLTATNAQGNFRALRMQITQDAGGSPVDLTLPVIKFGTSLGGVDDRAALGPGLHPQTPGRERPHIVHVWVHWPGHGLSENDDVRGRLHFPESGGIPTSEQIPLHIGGTQGMHLGELVVKILEGEWGGDEVRLAEPERTELLEMDLPRVWLRQLGEVERANWLQRNVYRLFFILPLPHPEDGLRLQRFWLPRDVDLGTVPLLDGSNVDAHTWGNPTREAVNHLVVAFRNLIHDREEGAEVDQLTATSYRVEEEHDTVALGLGERAHEVETDLIFTIQDSQDLASWVAQELFDLYGDGPVLRRLSAGAIAVPGGLRSGALVRVDLGDLGAQNTATSDRTGIRLARVLDFQPGPGRIQALLLDFGPAAIPPDPPGIAITQDAGDPDVLEVAVTGLTGDEEATVEVAYRDTDAQPPENAWLLRRSRLGNGIHRFRLRSSGGFGHGRGSTTLPGRLRSAWAYDSVALAVRALLDGVELELVGGVPRFVGIPAGDTSGIRIYYAITDAGDEPDSLDLQEDFEASELEEGLELAVTVLPGRQLHARVEPWTGFSGGSVAGDPGPPIDVSAIRPVDDLQPRVRVLGERWRNFWGDALADPSGFMQPVLRIELTPEVAQLRVEYAYRINANEPPEPDPDFQADDTYTVGATTTNSPVHPDNLVGEREYEFRLSENSGHVLFAVGGRLGPITFTPLDADGVAGPQVVYQMTFWHQKDDETTPHGVRIDEGGIAHFGTHTELGPGLRHELLSGGGIRIIGSVAPVGTDQWVEE